VTAAEEAVLQLSPEERLRLIERLWESLSDEEEQQLEVPAEVRAELDRRLAAHRENPGDTLTWEEVQRRVRGRG
jgi:putative addiction module component (TIGR02574 family)